MQYSLSQILASAVSEFELELWFNYYNNGISEYECYSNCLKKRLHFHVGCGQMYKKFSLWIIAKQLWEERREGGAQNSVHARRLSPSMQYYAFL